MRLKTLQKRERGKYDVLEDHHQSRGSGRIVHFSGRAHVFIGKKCELKKTVLKNLELRT